MVQTLAAREITLHELTDKFGLQLVEDEQFFREWQDDLPEITEEEKQRLDRVKSSYSNLLEDPPLLENTVKMVVLSPLLDLAGFYLPPQYCSVSDVQSWKIPPNPPSKGGNIAPLQKGGT
jgi:hypothetical protein